MLFDALNRFSNKQAVSATATSSIIDLRDARDIAVNSDLHIVAVPCTEDGGDVAGTGSVKVELQTSDVEAFTSPVTLATSADLTVAQLNAGNVGMKMPYGAKRYLRLRYVVTGTVTGLLMYSGIVLSVPHPYEYKHLMHS